MKGQLRPGRASVKQFKNKQQSEKFAKKRKLQDGEEGGEQIFKPGYQWKNRFWEIHCSSRSSCFPLPCYNPSKLSDLKFTSCAVFAVEKFTSRD